MASTDLNLATLPLLIIGKIIRVADLESFNGARLIAHPWNQLALETLKMRARLPVIHYFRWRVNHSNWHLFMQIADRYRGYFGVEKWLVNTMNEDEIVDIELAVDTRNSLMESRLSRLFDRCSRIEKVDITQYIENYEVIASAMGNTPVDELQVTNLRKFDNFSINTLVNFIRAHANGKITLRFDNYNLWSSDRLNLTTLFTEASRLVREIDCIVGDALPIDLANLRMSWENSLSSIARAANSTYIFESTTLQSGYVRLRFFTTDNRAGKPVDSILLLMHSNFFFIDPMQLNIASLPSDIIRKVINFAGMAEFEEMRLISPHWNETALAHIEVSKHRPVINVCRWWPHNTPGSLPNVWNMEITIAKEHVNYFGLDGWNRSDKPLESENKVRLGRRLTGVQEPWTRKRIVRLLSRCSHIETFELGMTSEDDVKSLSEVTGATTIGNLVIERVKELFPRLKNIIFEFIKQHSVLTLTLNDYIYENEYDLAGFIDSAMSLVAKLELIIIADIGPAYMAVFLRLHWESVMENIKPSLSNIAVRIEDSIQENGCESFRTIIERSGE